MRQALLLWLIAWLLVLGGALTATCAQRADGVEVENVRFPLTGGGRISALLYRPAEATPERPAPAVIAAHGFLNTREMQSAFAIELARRGFVVLATDMPGHGHSDGIVGAAGFGGPDALRFVQGLKFVDPANIGLEGHSMGGGAVMGAALADPDGYKSAVLVGSTPKFGGALVKPRNLAIVFGTKEEFAPLMWKVARGDAVTRSVSLQTFFGTRDAVRPGMLYGAIANGTARQLYLIPATHAQEHASMASVAAVTDWFGRTLDGERASRPAADQLWPWKEGGTLLSFAGALLLIAATFNLSLRLPWLAPLAAPLPHPAVGRDRGWSLRLAVITLAPALLYVPLMVVSQPLGPTPLFPQLVHNQVISWATGSVVAVTLLLALHRAHRWAVNRHVAKAIAASLISAGAAYLALVIVDHAFLTDMRFWIWGGRTFTLERLAISFPYLLLWTTYFTLVFRGIILHLAPNSGNGLRYYASFAAAISGGMMLFAAGEYGFLALTHRLMIPDYPLLAILSVQFVPVLLVTALLGAFVIRRTNDYLPAAILNALLVSWLMTTSTANHWSPGYETPVLPFAAAR